MRPNNNSELTPVGFWKPTTLTPHTSADEAALPDPHTLVDPDWSPAERAVVAAYLDAGNVVASYRGASICRICGVRNGSTERSDGTFRWPSGLSHYVRAHSVRLPDELIARVHAAIG